MLHATTACTIFNKPQFSSALGVNMLVPDTPACNFSSLISPRGSAPAVLASLLSVLWQAYFLIFPERNIGNAQFRNFSTSVHSCIFVLLALSSSLLVSDASHFHLCFDFSTSLCCACSWAPSNPGTATAITVRSAEAKLQTSSYHGNRDRTGSQR